jgi:homoserine dehydrogenase
VWVVGCGTVGQWLLDAVHSQGERLADRYGARFSVVGLANARDGFVYDERGLDVPAMLDLVGGGKSLAEQPGVRHWPTALDGLRATEADVLVEVTGSPADDGEPGTAHMREALARGIPVVTSNKWPVALHGVELAQLARDQGVALRTESTVMSGTPVLSALREGLAGATPISLRGVLNATANFILSLMAEGARYEDALAEAQRTGLAERDPSADVEGPDTVAKLMILAALAFRRQLRVDEVRCRGITDVDSAEVDRAASSGGSVRHVATLEFAEPDGVGQVDARVEPVALEANDSLARIEGTTNCIVCRVAPLGEVAISGPGAGMELAGQGVLSDLVAVARSRSPS